MNELKEIKLKNMIYEVRGKQVMLDSDLARLYGCKNGTKTINQAVNRNIERFPPDFYFKLNNYEMDELQSQIGTTNKMSRINHHVFTEQGIAMLATVLKTSIANNISISIMRTFVNLRKYVSSNLIEQKYINNQVMKNMEDIKILQESFEKLNSEEKNHQLFFEGQIYDSYSLLLDIFNEAKRSIIIIDNYIDKTILDILSKTNKNIILITNEYNNNDYEKYIKQYQNIKLKINNSFHDRFIIIDEVKYYHCGASFKDLGKKCFAINKMDDDKYLETLLNKIS